MSADIYTWVSCLDAFIAHAEKWAHLKYVSQQAVVLIGH